MYKYQVNIRGVVKEVEALNLEHLEDGLVASHDFNNLECIDIETPTGRVSRIQRIDGQDHWNHHGFSFTWIK